MPIYEYQCTACGQKLEAFQKISEDPLTECPDCHEDALKKCVTAAAFQLKGSGWYVTDFKDKKKPDDKPATNKDESTGKDKGETGKAEGKAETKGENKAADKNTSTENKPAKTGESTD